MKRLFFFSICFLAFSFCTTCGAQSTRDTIFPGEKITLSSKNGFVYISYFTDEVQMIQPSSQHIYQFSLPVKKWVGPVVVSGALAGSFIGGILHGKGEWELAEKSWPRSPESHHWRDAGNWVTGGSCAMFGVGIILNGKTNWKEMLFGGLGMGFSNWLGTRIGYYKMRKL